MLDVARSNLPLGAERIEPALSALADRAGQLVWLRLDENGLSAPGVLALVRAGEWTELAELGLRECGVNVPALAYLADHGRFPALTRLALAANAVDPVGLRAFLQAEFVSHLTHLDLTANRVGTDGARLLADAELGRLRWLSVEENGIGAAGLTALAKSTTLERLTTLKCLRNGSGDWWRLVRDRFPGDEAWGEDFLPEGEIPF